MSIPAWVQQWVQHDEDELEGVTTELPPRCPEDSPGGVDPCPPPSSPPDALPRTRAIYRRPA